MSLVVNPRSKESAGWGKRAMLPGVGKRCTRTVEVSSSFTLWARTVYNTLIVREATRDGKETEKV